MLKIIKLEVSRKEFEAVKKLTKKNFLKSSGLWVIVLLIYMAIFLDEILSSWLGIVIIFAVLCVILGIYKDLLKFKKNVHQSVKEEQRCITHNKA